MAIWPRVRLSRGGFTLIELLPVIAIIGILAAILIPTAGAVRASAKQAQCASNLRQIALGILTYAQDNRDRLPAGRNATGWVRLTRGFRNPASNYVEYNDPAAVESSVQLSAHLAMYLGTKKSGDYWGCPANDAVRKATTDYAAASDVSYMLGNSRETQPPYWFGDNGPNETPATLASRKAAANTGYDGETGGVAWSQVTEPTKLWILSDLDSINYGGLIGVPAATAANAVPMAHRGGRNYAFFDAHVELRKADSLPAHP